MPISPESQYIIDGGVECLHITTDTAISLYMSKYDMDRQVDIFDANRMQEPEHRRGSHMDGLVALGMHLQDDMDYWLNSEATPQEREIAYKTVLYGSSMQLCDSAKIIADELVDGYMITNGYTEGMRYQFGGKEGIYIPTKEDLLIPANVATAMSNRLYPWFSRMNGLIEKALKTDNYTIEELSKYYVENEKRNAFRLIESREDKYKHVTQSTIKNAKKALKKGVKKFSNLFGDKSIRSFLSGSEFRVEGKQHDYIISPKKSLSVIEQTHNPLGGHIPYNLHIVDKKSGLIIADGCVITEESVPIIDQIIGIMLYIKHDEQTLIDTANWFNYRKEFKDKPVNEFIEKFENRSESKSKVFEMSEQEKFETEMREELYKTTLEFVIPFVKRYLAVDDKTYKFMLESKTNPILEIEQQAYDQNLRDFVVNSNLELAWID